jgi:hypothetical protein
MDARKKAALAIIVLLNNAIALTPAWACPYCADHPTQPCVAGPCSTLSPFEKRALCDYVAQDGCCTKQVGCFDTNCAGSGTSTLTCTYWDQCP